MRRLLALLLLLALLVTACSADDGGDETTDAPEGDAVSESPDDATADATADGTDGEQGAAADAYPVTIAHKFGETTVEQAPERIVALGYTELDYVLALGASPVAARYPQFGDEATPVRSWAEDAAGGAEIQTLNYQFGEIDFEEIASLQPDLILGVTSGILAEEYEALSGIAPTVAQTDEYVDFGVPWQEITRTIGTALAETELAEELVADVEAQFAEVREAHPEWEGLSLASAYYGDGEVLFFASEDLRAKFFTDLGFTVPAELDEIAGDAFYGSISLEQLDLIDRDVLVWSQLAFTDGGQEAIESDPLVAELAAMQEGRVVFVDGAVDDALQVSTVLSLPQALDGVVPLLEDATAEAG